MKIIGLRRKEEIYSICVLFLYVLFIYYIKD